MYAIPSNVVNEQSRFAKKLFYYDKRTHEIENHLIYIQFYTPPYCYLSRRILDQTYFPSAYTTYYPVPPCASDQPT